MAEQKAACPSVSRGPGISGNCFRGTTRAGLQKESPPGGGERYQTGRRWPLISARVGRRPVTSPFPSKIITSNPDIPTRTDSPPGVITPNKMPLEPTLSPEEYSTACTSSLAGSSAADPARGRRPGPDSAARKVRSGMAKTRARTTAPRRETRRPWALLRADFHRQNKGLHAAGLEFNFAAPLRPAWTRLPRRRSSQRSCFSLTSNALCVVRTTNGGRCRICVRNVSAHCFRATIWRRLEKH